MSLTTYGGLKTSLAAWATRSDLTSTMDDFVFWAHQEICRKLRANVLLAEATQTISSETVNLPTGFLAFKRIYLDLTPRRTLHALSAEGAADLDTQNLSQQYPDYYSIEGANMRFAPQFTETPSLVALYYKAPTLMAADSDHNVVLDKYPYLYLYGALEALYTYLEDDNNASNYGQKFGALIEDINRSEAADVISGPLRLPNVTVV